MVKEEKDCQLLLGKLFFFISPLQTKALERPSQVTRLGMWFECVPLGATSNA